jgi:hypothetical protein
MGYLETPALGRVAGSVISLKGLESSPQRKFPLVSLVPVLALTDVDFELYVQIGGAGHALG